MPVGSPITLAATSELDVAGVIPMIPGSLAEVLPSAVDDDMGNPIALAAASKIDVAGVIPMLPGSLAEVLLSATEVARMLFSDTGDAEDKVLLTYQN
jgi:uncharacterized membrane protein YjjB (DUF3815 family)